MKKIFIILALSFSGFPISNIAYADSFVNAIQVECIPELYHLKISAVNISGEIPVENYKKNRDFFEKSMNLFDLSDVSRTHRITCAPPDGKYEVIIQPTYLHDKSKIYIGTRTAIITVKYDGKALSDDAGISSRGVLIDNYTLISTEVYLQEVEEIIFNTNDGYYYFVGYTEDARMKYPYDHIWIDTSVVYRKKEYPGED